MTLRMYRLIPIFFLAMACSGKAKEETSSPKTSSSPTASAPIEPGFSVSGKVAYTGRSSKRRKVKMNADAKCLSQHPKGFHYRSTVVGKNGGLANAFVYVKEGLGNRSYTPPAGSKQILKQHGCWYHPRISGIMVGQDLEILNNDPTMHNVNASPHFNAAMPPSVKQITKSFNKSKVMFRIKCNVHPWMTAYVGILKHPFYAVTDKNGNYTIENLPKGQYTLEVWHEKRGRLTQKVTVTASGAKTDFKFIKKKK